MNRRAVSPCRLTPPVQDASAWYGPALLARGNRLERLDAAEIEAASCALVERRTDPAQLQPADFPLTTLAPRLARLVHELLEGRGFVLLRGMPLWHWPRRLSAAAFLGLGCHLGNMRLQNAAGHLPGHARDVGLGASDPDLRIDKTRERQTFHTESCGLVGLPCLQTARAGGLSALTSTTSLAPGDMQFVHNHALLHDRTAFENWPEPKCRRHLLRLWLAAQAARRRRAAAPAVERAARRFAAFATGVLSPRWNPVQPSPPV